MLKSQDGNSIEGIPYLERHTLSPKFDALQTKPKYFCFVLLKVQMENPVTLSNQHPRFSEAKEHTSKGEALVEENKQNQPWKQYLEEINEVNQKNPLDKDFFDCWEGFNDHSLAG